MPLYRFDPADRQLEEFEPMCSWHQASPDSVFPGTLIVTRATERGRVSVRGMEWFREVGGRRKEGVFADPASRKSFIYSEFGFLVPAGPS